VVSEGVGLTLVPRFPLDVVGGTGVGRISDRTDALVVSHSFSHRSVLQKWYLCTLLYFNALKGGLHGRGGRLVANVKPGL